MIILNVVLIAFKANELLEESLKVFYGQKMFAQISIAGENEYRHYIRQERWQKHGKI